MESINLIYAYDLINKSKGKIFTANFTKKNGMVRIMNCRLHVRKNLNGNGLKYNPIEKGLITVYDMGERMTRKLREYKKEWDGGFWEKNLDSKEDEERRKKKG